MSLGSLAMDFVASFLRSFTDASCADAVKKAKDKRVKIIFFFFFVFFEKYIFLKLIIKNYSNKRKGSVIQLNYNCYWEPFHCAMLISEVKNYFFKESLISVSSVSVADGAGTALGSFLSRALITQ